MNARRARKRSQERAQYHAEQSKLAPDKQDLRYRLQQIRIEREVALAAVALELNRGIAELVEVAAESRKKIHEQFAERLKVAGGRAKSKKITKDAAEEARRLGIAIPTEQEMLQLVKERRA